MPRLSFKQYLLFIFAILFVFGGAYLKWREYVLPTAAVKIAGQEIAVEVARSPKAWQKGLSGRRDLAEGRGMLFVFPDSSRRGFWMKDMNFPLDIIWIEKGAVVDVAPRVPPASEANPPVFYPRLPANMVLEVKAGFSEKYGVKIGERVELRVN